MDTGSTSKFKPQKKDRLHKGPESGDHNSNWAISYGDMITLLLAFFVLFFSIDKDNKDIEILEMKITEEYKEPSEQKSHSQWGGEANRADTKNDGSDPLEKTSGSSSSLKAVNQKKPLNQGGPLVAAPGFAKDLPEVTTAIQGNKMIILFPAVSFFDSAQYSLTPDGDRALRRFARVFKTVRGRLRLVVRGYTDNRPVKSGKTYKDNMELSALRAISALRSLNSNGVPYHLMRIGGYGETDKSKIVSDKELQKFDRKVVLVVEPIDQTERGFAELTRSSVQRKDKKEESPSDSNKETI